MRYEDECFQEDLYLKALAEINSDNFSDKVWLIKYFDLYKQTLNWPKDLPPIRRSDVVKGTLKEKFHLTYPQILKELEYVYLMDGEDQTLEIY
jgi:hypothetical protein